MKTVNYKVIYKSLLKDYRWLKKRKKSLANAMHLCSNCKTKANLEVHHLYYVFGYSPWEYPDKALIVLCSKCHKDWHDKYKVEYRSTIWGKNKPYSPPLYNRTGRVKQVRLGTAQQALTPLEKAKKKIKARADKGKVVFSFAPIPKWRQQQKELKLV